MAKKKDIQEQLKEIEVKFIARSNEMLAQAFKPDPRKFTCLDKPGKVMTVDGKEVIVF